MIVVVDASAAVKLVLDEDHSDLARRAWDIAHDVIAPMVVVPEVAAAISAAARAGRIDGPGAARAQELWRALLDSMDRRIVDEGLAEVARSLAAGGACRGMDALYLAVARELREVPSALLSFDARQRDAAAVLGIDLMPASI